MSSTRVCVYGTLKSGCCNSSALRNSTLLGATTIRGPWKLVDLAYYPAMVPTAEGPLRDIKVEVWQVDEETLYALDMIEGHPTYYKRTKIDTPLGKAWCYFLPRAYGEEYQEIESGNWTEECAG